MTEAIVTLSSRGLVYIPTKMLKVIGLEKGKKAKLVLNNKILVIEKAPSLLEFAGALKRKKGEPKRIWKDFRAEMEKNYKRI